MSAVTGIIFRDTLYEAAGVLHEIESPRAGISPLRKVAARASRTICDLATRRWRAIASKWRALILSRILHVIVVMFLFNTKLRNEQYRTW